MSKARDQVGIVENILGVDGLDAAVPSESIVCATVHYLFNSDLAHGRGAHQAGLDGDVEDDAVERSLPDFATCCRVVPCCGENVVGLRSVRPDEPRRLIVRAIRKQVSERVEFGVERCIAAFVGTVPAAGDDFAVVHEDAANGDFADVQRFFTLYSSFGVRVCSVCIA